jgi:hypothetical protein
LCQDIKLKETLEELKDNLDLSEEALSLVNVITRNVGAAMDIADLITLFSR